jgi:hypothetical protein
VTSGTLDIEVSGSTAAVPGLSEAIQWNNGTTSTIRTVD